MNKVTLTVFVTLAMLLFTGETNHPSDNIVKKTVTVAKESTFSTANTLDIYIKKSPASVQVYYYTKKYCKKFHVPETVAFNVLKLETTYEGPAKRKYNHKRTSTGNAKGSFQVVLSTGKDMYVLLGLGKRNELTADRLMNDIELNVMIGVRYLQYLHDTVSSDWKVTCGFYNTGYKRVNGYAMTATKYI